jgi:hypothetical protein
MATPEAVRTETLKLLRGEGTAYEFEAAIADFPLDRINERPTGAQHSPWEILEHMRAGQREILEYVLTPGRAEPTWPGPWPADPKEADLMAWRKTIGDFRADLRTLQILAADPERDLLAPLDHAPTTTLQSELMRAISNNNDCIGELTALRRAMGAVHA